MNLVNKYISKKNLKGVPFIYFNNNQLFFYNKSGESWHKIENTFFDIGML